jgi:hypothetical protein
VVANELWRRNDIINVQPLLGMEEAGWPSKGGELMVAPTVRLFTVARRWAVV